MSTQHMAVIATLTRAVLRDEALEGRLPVRNSP
jgi:hypothetical protein